MHACKRGGPRQPCTRAQEQRFPTFVREYLRTMFPRGDVPKWVREALEVAGIDLEGIATVPVDQLGATAAGPGGGEDVAGPSGQEQAEGRAATGEGEPKQRGAGGKQGKKSNRAGRAAGPDEETIARAKQAKQQQAGGQPQGTADASGAG